MPNTSERKPAATVLEEIHERVNMDIVEALTEVLKKHDAENGQIPINVVCATLSYMLGDAIAQGSTHHEICSISESYGTYIHNLAHACREHDHPSSGVQEGLGGLIGMIFKSPKPN